MTCKDAIPGWHFVLESMGRAPNQLKHCLENRPSLGPETLPWLSQESHIILLLPPLCPRYGVHSRGLNC